MGSVHSRGDTFLTFGLKALTETNTSRLATGPDSTPTRAKLNSYKNQFNSVLYFNVLTQQLQEPITESAQTVNVQKYAYA
jgi:hypothetical protein